MTRRPAIVFDGRYGGWGRAAAATMQLLILPDFYWFWRQDADFSSAWLDTLAHVEAPSPCLILLSGILLKMGGIRLDPVRLKPYLRTFVITQGLAGFASLHQFILWRCVFMTTARFESGWWLIRQFLHMGIVLLGDCDLECAWSDWCGDADGGTRLTAGLLFLVVGLLYQRTHLAGLY